MIADPQRSGKVTVKESPSVITAPFPPPDQLLPALNRTGGAGGLFAWPPGLPDDLSQESVVFQDNPEYLWLHKKVCASEQEKRSAAVAAVLFFLLDSLDPIKLRTGSKPYPRRRL